MTPRPERLMVTVTEAAAVLGVSANTLKRAGEEGEIPMQIIRTVYLIPRAWLARITTWPPAESEVA